jgi:hypothetical protein
MTAPRFRLRSLVLLIVFLGMGLAIVSLTVRNVRLERELQAEHNHARAVQLLAEEALRSAELQAQLAEARRADALVKQATDGK